MKNSNPINPFNTKTLMSNIEKVIQSGLNDILENYMERYNLLEETHKKLMELPSIVYQLGKTKYLESELSDDAEDITVENVEDVTVFESIKDMAHNIIIDEISTFEKRLEKLEKNYDSIVPILDKILNKMNSFKDDIFDIKTNVTEKKPITENIEKSSVVKTSEDENIKFTIEETYKNKEFNLIKNSDNINPLLETFSTIVSEEKESEKVTAEEKINESEELEEDAEETKEVKVKDNEKETEAEIKKKKEESEEVGPEETQKVKDIEESEESKKSEGSEEAKVEDVEESEGSEEAEVEEREEAAVEDVEESEEETENAEEGKEFEDEVETEASENDELETEESENEVNELSEEEEIFEIDIDDKTYCTNNDENGFIWELTEQGEQGDKVGYFKESEPFFYADEN